MPSALSKRQQARNERTLQELITSVAGNDRCADCGARNPGELSHVIVTRPLLIRSSRLGQLECKSSAPSPFLIPTAMRELCFTSEVHQSGIDYQYQS